MMKPPTIRDVAREAGVSVGVVSRVINEGTGPVAPQTRERVLGIIEDLGFRPRAAARSLVTGAATIGLVLTDLANPFFARLADRIVWEARSSGSQIVLMTTQEDAQLEREILDRLQDRSVAAVIATPTGANADKWTRLHDLGIHLTFVDRWIEGLGVDHVGIGNVESARVATDHLLQQGHRRIGLISGPLTTSTGRERAEGYRAALADHDVPVAPELVQGVSFRGDAGSDAVGMLLNLPEPPTALVVANTAQVRNALRRLRDAGTSIPDELSIIVFDDNPWTEVMTPPLSVVRPPVDMLAVHSLEMVLSRLRGTATQEPRAIAVDAEFVPRGSSTPPLAAATLPTVV